MATRKVIVTARVGDPKSGGILAPGATVELPEFWAERYVSQGKARYADEKKAKSEPAADEAKAESPKPKGKKK
jgi:hypothetical protein